MAQKGADSVCGWSDMLLVILICCGVALSSLSWMADMLDIWPTADRYPRAYIRQGY